MGALSHRAGHETLTLRPAEDLYGGAMPGHRQHGVSRMKAPPSACGTLKGGNGSFYGGRGSDGVWQDRQTGRGTGEPTALAPG